MKLNKIRIKNFRSIKDQTIEFDKNCIILLGKNEAGKSNILKAIAAIFGQYKVKDSDRRKRIDSEKIDYYNITGTIALSNSDIEKISSKCSPGKNIKFNNNKTITEFVRTKFSFLEISIEIGSGKNPQLKPCNNKDDDEFSLSSDNVSGPTLQGIIDNVFTITQQFYKDEGPRCHYWQYDSKYLLPNSINISSFVSSPESISKGLYNLFVFCDRENIAEEFEKAKKEDGDYVNLLNQVSQKATNTFRSIWQDFKNTSIILQPDGPDISIKVANKARYSFEDRSDGFKRFVCILLMLSTPARDGQIGEKDIILIDEPDNSLYPTSARFLKDELLKISSKSIVVYATHSQYMIDTTCIDRHIIVEKENDITTLRKEEQNSTFSTDELLLNAIGTSIFECIKHTNLIFEGFMDQKLFDNYCLLRNKSNKFDNTGKVFLDGIKGVTTLVQLLILANKKFIIISDSDRTSTCKKEDFLNSYPQYANSWIGYGDVVKNIETVEDFLKEDYIEKEIVENYDKDFKFNDKTTAIQNIEKVAMGNREKKQKIKNDLISKARLNNIKDEYDEYVNRILECITTA